jgi:6-phosphogluconolactonase (cycloisomerase 2 family)
MVSPDPAGGPLFVVDLGTDSIHRYDPDPVAGRLRPYGVPLRTQAGAGPRHLVRHPDGRHCYLVGELDGTVLVYRRDDRDDWHEVGRVPASGRTGHVQPSEVALDAGGWYLYVANRGVGTLTAFALDAGLPRAVAEVDAGGDRPRHFAIIGRDIYVAQERADEVTHFTVDPATGIPPDMLLIMPISADPSVAAEFIDVLA